MRHHTSAVITSFVVALVDGPRLCGVSLTFFSVTSILHITVVEPAVSLSLRFSGDQRRLPGLSRSTGSSAPSLHTRSGPRGKEDTTDFTHTRRRSGFVPVRALLLLSDWSVGHEVGSRSPQDATPHGGVSKPLHPRMLTASQ